MRKEKTKKDDNDEEYGYEEYEEEMEEEMDEEEPEDFGDIDDLIPNGPKKQPTRKKTIKEESPAKKADGTVSSVKN